MLMKALENQGAFGYLDAPPRVLTAGPNRPAYALDMDYVTNPSHEDIVAPAHDVLSEGYPLRLGLRSATRLEGGV